VSIEKPVDIFEPVIATLRAQIEEWQRMIERLEWMRTNGTVGAPALGAAPMITAQNGGPSFNSDSFFGLTIADAAKKYLNAMKKPVSARAIAEALLAGGWKSAARNPIDNVRSTLSRMPAFVLISGEFGLSEWYPGRKVASKQRPASQQGSPAGDGDDSFSDKKEPL
jgi:hypothetical protein